MTSVRTGQRHTNAPPLSPPNLTERTIMNLNGYQIKATTFAAYGKQKSYPFLALSEEVGEVMGKLAKRVRKMNVSLDRAVFEASSPMYPSDHELRANLVAELGDVLWQLTACCKELNIDLSTVAAMNIEKLTARQAAGTIVGEGDNR